MAKKIVWLLDSKEKTQILTVKSLLVKFYDEHFATKLQVCFFLFPEKTCPHSFYHSNSET
eukprot:03592.XXX_7572_7751_1 [CDS] Oithona nana genome sequencing.